MTSGKSMARVLVLVFPMRGPALESVMQWAARERPELLAVLQATALQGQACPAAPEGPQEPGPPGLRLVGRAPSPPAPAGD